MESSINKVLLLLAVLFVAAATITSPTCSTDLFKDVVFVIDTSTSIGSRRFELIREFTANVTTALIETSPRSAVGVISFSTTARVEFNLQAHTSLSALLSAIAGLPYRKGITRTDRALRLLASTAKDGQLGLRNGSTNIAIFITDGRSNNQMLTVLAADELNSLNIFDVYAVGIRGADMTELQTIASRLKFVFFTPNFTRDGLEQVKNVILPQICIVNLPPVITKNPAATSLFLMSNFTNVSFSCEADGASSYYWERQHDSVPPTASGVNTSTLTITNLQPKDTGYYRCVATNGGGSTESKYAKLTINGASPSKIVNQPTDTSAANPFSGVFTCSVVGYGYQNISWYKQSGTLPYKHKTYEVTSGGITTSTLIIPNVTEEDVGRYYCQVWANNIGVRSKKVKLIYPGIPPKPTVALQPGQLIKLGVNNYTIRMRCLPYDSNFSYKWERKNNQLPVNALYINTEQLTVTNLKPEDSGEYRCIMSNSTGQIASNYSLVTVKVALPRIIRQPSPTVTAVYDIATFECMARSYGSVSITWQRLNSKLPVTANITMTKSLNEVKSTLRIDKSIGYYKGYYYCVIRNKAGVVNSTVAYCNVTVPCPQMIIAPQPIVVRPSAAVTFSCLAWSFGGLVYKWNRNGSSNLPSNTTVFFQDKSLAVDNNCFTTVYELKIVNVHVRDEGFYCCIASNECGSSKECAWLEVDTSPIIIMQPKSQALKEKEQNVLALWIAATGVGPIHYQWQKYDPHTNSWISPSNRADNITSPNLTFSVITEEDQGLYHCIASNDDGNVLSHDAKIIVYGSPNITYYTNGIVVFERKKVNMVCNATNDEDAIDPVQISWYNGTKLLKSDEKHVIIFNKHDNFTDKIHSMLVLDSVNNTDDGEYICRAYNDPLCYTEKKINLTIEYAPRITIDPAESPHTVAVGERLFLYCIAEGFPIPRIQWYVNNTSIPQQSSPLYLAFTDAPSTTVYTCEGKNNAGNMQNIARATITVIVGGCKKFVDPDNGRVFHISATTAIFSCDSGFTTIGNPYLQCINGKWNSLPPKCQPV